MFSIIFSPLKMAYPKDPRITPYQKRKSFYATFIMSHHLDEKKKFIVIWRWLSELFTVNHNYNFEMLSRLNEFDFCRLF